MRDNRRRDFRFHPPNVKVTATHLKLTLLDLGRSGMNIESQGPASVEIGDEHIFRLEDGANVVEVVGQVRWVTSPSGERTPGTGKAIRQKAGIAFVEVLSEAAEGMWKDLTPRREPSLGDPPRSAGGFEKGEDREADPVDDRKVVMIEPQDGDTVSTPVIEVVGTLDDSLQVHTVVINGAPATLEGSRFVSKVRLKSGANKISATVHKRTGGYNTFLLGTVTLDPLWKTARSRSRAG